MQSVPQLEVITTDIHTPVRCFISEDYGSYVPVHYHSALELIYVLSGSMGFTVNGLSAEQINLAEPKSTSNSNLQTHIPHGTLHHASSSLTADSSVPGGTVKRNPDHKLSQGLGQSSGESSSTLPNHAPDFRMAKLPDFQETQEPKLKELKDAVLTDSQSSIAEHVTQAVNAGMNIESTQINSRDSHPLGSSSSSSQERIVPYGKSGQTLYELSEGKVPKAEAQARIGDRAMAKSKSGAGAEMDKSARGLGGIGANSVVPNTGTAGGAGAECGIMSHGRYATPSLFNVGKVSASAFSAGQETQYLTTQQSITAWPKLPAMPVGTAYQELAATGNFNCVLFNSKELHMTCCPVYNRSLVVQIPEEFLLSSLGLTENDEVTFALALASPQCLQHMQEALIKLTQLIDFSPRSVKPIVGKEIRFKQALYTLLECLLEVKVTPRQALAPSAADNPSRNQSLNQLRKRVYPVLDLVNRHYAEDISLTQVAAKLHVHPNYFCRIFKQVVGQSFHAYLSEVRLCHIYQDVLASTEPVATIVSRNGMVCNNFFYRQFKRRFNITPSALRQHYGKVHEAD